MLSPSRPPRITSADQERSRQERPCSNVGQEQQVPGESQRRLELMIAGRLEDEFAGGLGADRILDFCGQQGSLRAGWRMLQSARRKPVVENFRGIGFSPTLYRFQLL